MSSPSRHCSAPHSSYAGAPAAERDPRTPAVPRRVHTQESSPATPGGCGCTYCGHCIARCFWKSGFSGLIAAAERVVRKCEIALCAAFFGGAREIKPYAGTVIRLWGAVGMTSAPPLSGLFCCEQHLPGLEQSRNPSPSLFLLNDGIRRCTGLAKDFSSSQDVS